MVTYKGIQGVLVAEKSVENEPIVMWVVRLITGQVIMEPMWCFEIHTVSVLEEVVNKYREAA